MLRNIRVYFDDGRRLETSINGSDKEIRAYYLGKQFEYDETKATHKAVEVEFTDIQRKFAAQFIGRKVGAIGITYPIRTTVAGETREAAQNNLYDRYDHISELELVEIGGAV